MADRTAALRNAELRARRRAERGLVAHNRLKNPDVLRLYEERIAVALLRLSPEFGGELTAAQVEAGETVARIYGEFERVHGRHRAAASPHYERAYGPGGPAVWSDGKIARAQRRYARLQAIIDGTPSPAVAREVIETLCVDDQPIAAAMLPGLRWLLDQIANSFGLEGRRSMPALPPARRFPRRDPSRKRRGEHVDRRAWENLERQWHPDMTESELEQKWRAQREALAKARALQDREKFRADKKRRRV